MMAYEVITNRILEKLEEGIVPWQRPWRVSPPKNFISDKPYKGINIVLLGMMGYGCSYWATFKQIKTLGGFVNRGERSTPIVFWSWRKVEDKESGETKEVPFLKYYNVFNLKQTSGIEIPKEEETHFEPIERCEEVVDQMPLPPKIDFNGGSRAYYQPRTDEVHLPKASKFHSVEEYYSTLFHELVHSTGHKKRLDRPGIGESSFGSEKYSREELVAEIGAAFLCGHAGIENRTIDNSAAYIDNWLQALKDDKKLVVIAAGQAQKASDYICNY